MKLKTLLIGIAAAVLLILLGLVAANVADYVRFNRALARVKTLTPEQLQHLGKWTSELKGETHFDRSHVPAELKILAPLSGMLSREFSELKLYELGDIYINLKIKTSQRNQNILYSTNAEDPLSSVTLWWKDPELAKELAPTNRLVTLRHGSRRGFNEWIVLPDAIWAVKRARHAGEEDQVVRRALTSADHAIIAKIVRDIPASVRGKDVLANTLCEGERLSISFTPEGSDGLDNISLFGTWIPELAPLLDAIDQFGPKDHPIPFLRRTAQELYGDSHLVRTQAEAQVHDCFSRETPWWCQWRSLIFFVDLRCRLGAPSRKDQC